MKINWLRLRNFDDFLHLIIKISLVLVFVTPLVAPIFSRQLESFNYYFPFIVPRNIYWRFLVELALTAYLFLTLRHKVNKPQLNKAYTFFILFVVSLFISSLLAQNFVFSFWSNYERMDGLVNWLHLLAYVFVLAAYLGKNKESWQFLMRVSVFVAILVSLHALGQKLEWSWLIASSGGARLAATLGNAAYVGSYLFLHLVILSYLFILNIRSKKLWALSSWVYFFSAILFIYVLVATNTRGPFLALMFFVFFMALAYLWFQRKSRPRFYYVVAGLLCLMVFFVALLFIQKQSAWVKAVPLFQKISSISLSDTSTQSRLLIWGESLRAFKEKPIFGWGEENFIYAFNKYFPTKIYHGAGSETWFDRPHNILVQHLIHGGLVAVSLYLAIFIYLIIVLYKQYKKDHDWLINFLWIGFLLSFLLQDLFIFDNLSVSVVFYLLLAFLIANLGNETGGFWSRVGALFNKVKIRRTHYKILPFILLFLFLWSLQEMVYKPLLSNKILVNTLRDSYLASSPEDFNKLQANWEHSVNLTSLGDKEKVEVLLQMFQSVLNNKQATDQDKRNFFALLGSNFEDMAAKYPDDVRFNMILSSFYANLMQVEPVFAQKNVALLERLEAYAPNRPDIKMSLTGAYLQVGNLEGAKKVALAAKDLVPDVREVYWNLVYVYVQEKNLEDLDISLKKIIVLNMQIDGITLTQEDVMRLRYILSRVDQKKDPELYKVLNNFMPTEQE